MVNAEIPSAAWISIRAKCWDCETVRTVRQSRYISMYRRWRPWNKHPCEAVQVLMALWWLYVSSSGETRNHFLSQIWPWKSRSIAPPNNMTLSKVFYISGPNLVVLAWTDDELSHGQAQKWGQSPSKTIRILNKVFYTYGQNLVILAWMGDELLRGQTWWRTDGLMDRRMQRQYP